jgi:hypothetical protein
MCVRLCVRLITCNVKDNDKLLNWIELISRSGMHKIIILVVESNALCVNGKEQKEVLNWNWEIMHENKKNWQ